MSLRKHKEINKSSLSTFLGGALNPKFALIFLIMLSLAVPAFATHDNSASLEPVWSPAEQNVNYTVEICNVPDGNDSIDEVRIYQNEKYSDFIANVKIGWYLSDLNPVKKYYQYTAENSSYYIDKEECTTFAFSATTPPSSPENCNLNWRFETRDITDNWKYVYPDPTTSVDDLAPEVIKDVIGPQSGPCPPGQGQECWVTQSTDINITVIEKGDCGISGLDYCEITYTVDGGSPVQEIYADLDGEKYWEHIMSFDEDSVHDLNVTCYDIAGNSVEDIETFRVDDTPPETTKDFIGPKKIEGDVEWIDGVTTVELTPVDPDPTGYDCNVGVEKTWYINLLAECEDPCWISEACMPVCPNPYDDPDDYKMIEKAQLVCEDWQGMKYDSWEECVEEETWNRDVYCVYGGKKLRWHLYDGTPIPKDEESCHILQFFSVDRLGNVEDDKVNCFFVDKTPPVRTKEVGQPKLNEDIEKLGNGYAEWTTEEAYSGASSAKLVIPDDALGTDFAGVDSFFDVFVELDDITSLSYYRKVTQYDNGWSPIVILGIDTDGDGVFEAQPLEWEAGTIPRNPALLGDDSIIQCEAVTGLSGIDSDFVQVDAYNNFKCYTATADGTDWDWSVYEPLSYFQSTSVGRVDPTDEVAMVKVELGGNPSTQDNEIAYVDKVEFNGNVIIDEPEFTWVRDHVTEITLDCVDPEPHPSGDEEVCYKVSFDLPQQWTDITDQYCDPEDLELIEQEGHEGTWCCVDAPETIVFVEDSFHDLEYFCRDAVNKKSEIDLEWFRVDSVPPEITKTMIGTDHLAKVGTCPPTSPSDECYVRDDGLNGVRVDVIDPDPTGMDCAVDEVTCTYELWWEGQNIDSGTFGEEGVDIYFTEDSIHTLIINCEDALGNEMDEDVEEFLVDSTPPETEKTYGEPTKVVGDYRWITSQTPITLEAEDEKVGVKEIKYRVTLQEQMPDVDCKEVCSGTGSGDWTTVTGVSTQFTIPQDSCHFIEFYSVDLLGNTEVTKSQCVFVDNKPPIAHKEEGEPLITDDGFDWVTKNTEFTLYCEDQEPHPVDQETIYWRFSTYIDGFAGMPTYSDWDSADYTQFPVKVSFPEDCWHDIEVYCVDHLGNESEHLTQNYIVDTQPPVIVKEVIGPQVDCSEGDSEPVLCDRWACLDGLEKDFFTTGRYGDNNPTAGAWELAIWEVNGGENVVDQDNYGWTSGQEVSFSLSYDPSDGSVVYTVSDKTLTHTYDSGKAFGYIIPFAKGNENGNSVELTNMVLNGTPLSDVSSGDNYKGLKVPLSDEDQVTGFTITGTAKLTWSGNTKNEIPGFHIFVMNTHDPMDCYLIDSVTEIHVDAYDPEPHPVDEVECEWGYDWLGQFYGWYTPEQLPFIIQDLEESEHILHIVCVDALGNEVEDVERFLVDKTPPTTSKEYGDPFYEDDGGEWITSATEITLTVEDTGPHKSGVAETQYRVSGALADSFCNNCEGWMQALRPNMGAWTTYTAPFTIAEESCHVIEFRSIDNVGKEEEIKWQCVFVDNSAPDPVKTVGEPKEEWDGADSIFYPEIAAQCGDTMECWKVTLLTPIQLECVDPEPHPVDHETVCFYVEVDAEDETSDYCEEYSGDYNANEDGYCCMEKSTEPFYFLEETEHNLEYYCVDALENKGPIDHEKFKVEGTRFEIQINKKWNLISVPFVLLEEENDIAEVLEDIEENVKAVWTYDAFTNQWYVYTPDGDSGNDNLHTMDPGWGYWLSAYDSDTLILGGSLFSPATTPPSRQLKEGWNLIGYYGVDDGGDPPEAILEYDGPDGEGKMAHCALWSLGSTVWDKGWTSLWTYWEPENPDQWKSLDKLDNMDPGAGYWVSLPEDETYSVTTSCGFLLDLIGP